MYYVASQIKDSEALEYDNPAVKPFIEKIQPDITPLFAPQKGEMIESWDLEELAKESTHYILDIVQHMLSKSPSSYEYLSCIKDACLDKQLLNIDIHTLNHDLLLEQCLAQNGLRIIDGFTSPQNEMRYWDPTLFDTQDCKIRFIKLHGSLNWFRFRPINGSWDNEYIGIRADNGQERMPELIDRRPIVLAGTFNKMLDYTAGIYTDLHYQFYNSLRMTSVMVVSGYSFRDRGINNRIIDWFYSSLNNRIVVIHPEQHKLKSGARGSISNKWDHWIKAKRLLPIEKPIEDTSWQDVQSLLANDI